MVSFELGPSLRALLEEAAGSGSALQRERTRKVAADASRAELELVRELGLVAPIAEFERAQERMNAVLRQAVMTVPARVAMNLVGEKSEIKIKQLLTTELGEALRRVAEADLNLETEDDEFEN